MAKLPSSSSSSSLETAYRCLAKMQSLTGLAAVIRWAAGLTKGQLDVPAHIVSMDGILKHEGPGKTNTFVTGC